MKLSNIKKHIPSCIGSLIVLKGLISLAFGLISFFLNVTPTKSLTGIVIGIGYFFLGRGLWQGKQLAWRVALFWLGLNLIDSLFPNILMFQAFYVVLMIILLWSCRDYFTKKNKNPLRPQQLIAFFSVSFAMVYGVVGCYLLQDQYQGIHNWADAIYYSLETYSTIGYGDIIPLTTNARVFTCTMIIIGVGSFITAITVLFGPAMEQRMKKVVNMVNKLNTPKDHIIVLGATTLGVHIGKVLRDQGDAVIMVDPHTEALKAAQDAGFRVVSSDVSTEDVLTVAGIKTSKGLVCAFDSDAKNLLATMVANKLRQSAKLNLKIITRIDEPQNIPYATDNGADQVISPAVVLGELVAKTLAT